MLHLRFRGQQHGPHDLLRGHFYPSRIPLADSLPVSPQCVTLSADFDEDGISHFGVDECKRCFTLPVVARGSIQGGPMVSSQGGSDNGWEGDDGDLRPGTGPKSWLFCPLIFLGLESAELRTNMEPPAGSRAPVPPEKRNYWLQHAGDVVPRTRRISDQSLPTTLPCWRCGLPSKHLVLSSLPTSVTRFVPTRMDKALPFVARPSVPVEDRVPSNPFANMACPFVHPGQALDADFVAGTAVSGPSTSSLPRSLVVVLHLRSLNAELVGGSVVSRRFTSLASHLNILPPTVSLQDKLVFLDEFFISEVICSGRFNHIDAPSVRRES